mmetsp:Transcript_13776/g.13701  ORF Transcript_13776/g.13701 Transcript_13776/m.13701 type:complete len:439 (-) Transcript_13776:303-1619(-)
MLKSIHESLANKSVGYKNMEIPIIRMDFAKFKDTVAPEDLFVNRVPKTFVYFKHNYHPFEEFDNERLFLHFLNRLFYPVVILKTKKDVNNFLKTDKEWIENTPFYNGNYISIGEFLPQYTKITRVIAFVSEKSEYKEELKTLAEDARDLSLREDLRIAKITNPKIVSEFKDKHEEWFGDMSSNSIVAVVKDADDKSARSEYYDLSIDTELFPLWINRVSLQPVELLTGTSIKIINMNQKAMFTAFINKKSSKIGKKSKDLVKRLKEIAKDYPHYQFTYTEESTFKEKKADIGITWNEEPALAYFNFLNQDKKMVFPRKQPLSKKNLKAFFDACWNGKIENNELDLPDKIRNFDKNMKNATKLTLDNVDDFLNAEHKDKMVLIFDSSKDFDQGKRVSQFFGKAATRFFELELQDNITLGFFDTSLQNLPDSLEEYTDQP